MIIATALAMSITERSAESKSNKNKETYITVGAQSQASGSLQWTFWRLQNLTATFFHISAADCRGRRLQRS